MSYLPHVNGKRFTEASAAELREAAAAARQRAEDSFQRSDTDGFLSQWASGLTAEQYDRQAQIVEAGGMADFTVLIETRTGRIVSRRELPGRYIDGIWRNAVWTLSPADRERFGRGFIPTGQRSRVQKQLGLSESTETAPAVAVVQGRGTGLSGTAWVTVVRRREVE